MDLTCGVLALFELFAIVAAWRWQALRIEVIQRQAEAERARAAEAQAWAAAELAEVERAAKTLLESAQRETREAERRACLAERRAAAAAELTAATLGQYEQLAARVAAWRAYVYQEASK